VEKGGLADALGAAGVTAAARLAWGDEMRVGLCGCVRRAWAPRGTKVRQRVQMKREWRYLALAVEPGRGTLTWAWIANMKGPQIAAAAAHWRDAGLDAVVWDGASGHRAPAVQQVGLTLVPQPPYAPELNPAERVFEALRRECEGEVYATLDDKIAVVERALQDLAADPERVKRLTGWTWIRTACERLREKVVAL
jgi:DDE superfamily endonuclease